jgi:hypothetical protein
MFFLIPKYYLRQNERAMRQSSPPKKFFSIADVAGLLPATPRPWSPP